MDALDARQSLEAAQQELKADFCDEQEFCLANVESNEELFLRVLKGGLNIAGVFLFDTENTGSADSLIFSHIAGF